MADIRKDAEDRMFESLFRSTPIADDGFSDRVVTRIRRRLWLRRLALPVALVFGSAIAFKPVEELAMAASRLFAVMPPELVKAPVAWLPDVQTMVLGAVLLVAGVFGARMIEN